jgi:hypothetical protein
MCTPALPKPMPADVAAMAMFIRASTSSPSRTAVRKDRASSCSAFSDRMSATGFAAVGHPLVGRLAREGRVGLGGVALQRVAQDVHAGGGGHQRRLGPRQPGVHDGERGAQAGVADAGLDLEGQHVRTQMVVLSDPVPVVVGTATSGRSGSVGAAPCRPAA